MKRFGASNIEDILDSDEIGVVWSVMAQPSCFVYDP